MRRASKYGFSNLDTAYELTAYLWTLRLLVLFSDGTNFYPELCTKDAELTSFLKLPERDSLHTPAKLLQHLKRKLATAERRQQPLSEVRRSIEVPHCPCESAHCAHPFQERHRATAPTAMASPGAEWH